MAAKQLHFEKAFLSLAQGRAGEDVFPVVLRDANVKLAARDIGLPGTVMRLPLPRIKTRRKRTER